MIYLYWDDMSDLTFDSMFSMSAIDFFCSVDKIKGVDGMDRVVLTFDGKYLPHTEQVSFLFYIS